MLEIPGDPRAEYRRRFTYHDARRDAAARRSGVLSNVRAATFVAAVASLVVYEELAFPAAWIPLGVVAALVVAFIAEVVVHRRARRAERWEGALSAWASEGLLRLARDWVSLTTVLPSAERAAEEAAPEHPYARDIGVTGEASLVRLIGPVTSERGRAILRAWLLEPSSPSVAGARQGAVRELAHLTDFRAELTVRGRLDGPRALTGLGRFLTWAEAASEAASLRVALVGAWVLPPLTILGLVAYLLLDWVPWWILPALAQMEVLRRNRRRLATTLADAALGGPPLRALVPQLELLAGQECADPLLVSLSERLGRDASTAHLRLGRLSRLLDTVESRRNAFYAMLAPILLLDVHLCGVLDRWRAAHGQLVRDWIEALGEWEALSALATLAHDHPDWAFPTLETGGTAKLEATALGHPLLVPETCVRNDVLVGPPGTFLLVTGSNMSGKSTLLRAIGANVVLARAGAPVCAEALSLPPVRVHTSMRIEDSLAEGISLFMAELLRIKEVVEAADGTGAGERILYLLDEILHGTNTAERRIAARGVVRHLLASEAIGVVSTHDLTLADAPDLASAAHSVHFREEVESAGPTTGPDGARPAPLLTFDYRLREGIATTRNALKLLDAVGLGGLELEEGD